MEIIMKDEHSSLHSVYQGIFLNALKNAIIGLDDVAAERILPEKMTMNEPNASYEITKDKGTKKNGYS